MNANEILIMILCLQTMLACQSMLHEVRHAILLDPISVYIILLNVVLMLP